jgi:hypothetical protein
MNKALKDNFLILMAFAILTLNKVSLLFFSDPMHAKAFYHITSSLHVVVLLASVLIGKVYKRIYWAYTFLFCWLLLVDLFHSGIFSFIEVILFFAFIFFTWHQIEKGNDNQDN